MAASASTSVDTSSTFSIVHSLSDKSFARAELVAPGALLEALKKGRPGYAAMDVYEEEPVTGGNHPFLKMDNVLCTPHLGWAEWDNFELYFRECFEQIVAFEKGQPLRLGNPTVKPRAKA